MEALAFELRLMSYLNVSCDRIRLGLSFYTCVENNTGCLKKNFTAVLNCRNVAKHTEFYLV
jgi:hypothetical protein